ncbi:MAG: ATP-binding protein [Deltaproteobacteria bacterium]|nr:ATP-binding protein [Deltaproteobacteria bacterium]
MKNTSLGIEDFLEIRNSDLFYADKTKLLYSLLQINKPYFLSRPRRFGKSLLVSTLEYILEGRRDLFKGLWIDQSDYHWTPTPVIHLSLDNVSADSVVVLNEALNRKLKKIALQKGLTLDGGDPAISFEELIEALHYKYGRKPAVLIDEYDAPILRKIKDIILAEDIRNAMGTFFAAMKAAAKSRGFTFITGITKFTQTSVFSKLNNLDDLTLNDEYSDICGLTYDDFDSFIKDQMEEIDPKDPKGRPIKLRGFISKGFLPQEATIEHLREKILALYDGYSWGSKSRLLNPWSVFSAFQNLEFGSFWLSSGKSQYFSELIGENFRFQEVFRSDNYLTNDLNAIDVGDMSQLALFFQTGYLTVDKREVTSGAGGYRYYLRIPNLEVEGASYQQALGLGRKEAFDFAPLFSERSAALLAALIKLDAKGIEKLFGTILANIPQNIMSSKESYYQTIFLLALGAAGQRYDSESQSGDGICDVQFCLGNGVQYVVEMKYVSVKKPSEKKDFNKEQLQAEMKKAADKALAQIEEKKYTRKFQGQGSQIYKVALVVAHYTDVLVVFEKAENWRLARGLDGLMEVVEAG